ncbi:MAG TPA: hypothetical protein VFJ77_02825 [Gaiellaceae bacterium]|nr:hypothetical protein [Gaiellaceae bacterium]
MRRLALVPLVLAVVAAGCGGTHDTGRSTAPKATLVNLDSTDRFRAIFNRAAGEPRLVVIVSPT